MENSRDGYPNCTIFFILTAWPWAERGSCFARGLFYFILVLSVTRCRRPLRQVVVGTLNHETCNIYLPKAFETLTQENVTDIVFFIVCKMYFQLVLLKRSIRSKVEK